MKYRLTDKFFEFWNDEKEPLFNSGRQKNLGKGVISRLSRSSFSFDIVSTHNDYEEICGFCFDWNVFREFKSRFHGFGNLSDRDAVEVVSEANNRWVTDTMEFLKSNGYVESVE